MTTLHGFPISPGYHTLVALSGTKIEAVQSLKDISVTTRNCYFPDETETVKLFKNYSQTNCFFECILNITHERLSNRTLKCTPWYFPTLLNDTYFCPSSESVIFSETFTLVNPSLLCPQCLPDCKKINLKKSITMEPFRKCDEKNFGVSQLCDYKMLKKLSKPQIWSDQVLKQLENSTSVFDQSLVSSAFRFSRYPIFTDIR